MKKITAIITAIAVILSFCSTAAAALSIGTEEEISLTRISYSADTLENLKSLFSDYNGFTDYMRNEIYNGHTTINVRDYNIPWTTETSDLLSYFMNYVLTDSYYFNSLIRNGEACQFPSFHAGNYFNRTYRVGFRFIPCGYNL